MIMKKRFLIIPLLIILIIISIFVYNSTKTFIPQTNSISQYGGQPDWVHSPEWSWMEDHPYTIDFSQTSIIGKYKIEVQKTWRGVRYGEPYCISNTCGGTPVGTDSDGCTLWEGTRTEEYRCDLGCTCGSTGCGKCGSCTFDVPGEILSCSVTGGSASDKGCSISGDTLTCGGCIPIVSGGNCADSKCSANYKYNCGGLTQDKLYEGDRECWSQANVYYEDNLIHEFGWDNRMRGKSFLYGQESGSDIAELRIDIHTDDDYTGGCNMIMSDFAYRLPSDSFVLNISANANQVFEEQPVQIKVSIENKYSQAVLGNLIVEFEVPTTIGSAKNVEEKIIDIPIGVNEYLFDIPTTQITDKLFVKPKIDLLMAGNTFLGANYHCYGQLDNQERSLSTCAYVPIGFIEEPTFTVNIIPKPLYIVKPGTGCPAGYHENVGDTSLCIRDDISGLSCFILGCPVIEGHDYQCTSSGFCAETVFVEKNCTWDSDCPNGTKCDVGSGLCIKTEIFKEILQCDQVSDCPTPCVGKTKECSENKCVFTGECSPTLIDCTNVGCAEGYDCNKDNGICEKETIISVIPQWVWIVGISAVVLIIFLIIILIFKRK